MADRDLFNEGGNVDDNNKVHDVSKNDSTTGIMKPKDTDMLSHKDKFRASMSFQKALSLSEVDVEGKTIQEMLNIETSAQCSEIRK